jgi:hypothetical protein|uniref:Uncharacterized protein n=1 Tax=Picea glauca TaxID=3330 RepID=A0A117NHS9_PICGL|nr:hypothetical protein ABT39_MTgene4196 [Picea glauca]QHR86610.1 hypothetical protein Q903MT_gene613 [Picea sitchensis]
MIACNLFLLLLETHLVLIVAETNLGILIALTPCNYSCSYLELTASVTYLYKIGLTNSSYDYLVDTGYPSSKELTDYL